MKRFCYFTFLVIYLCSCSTSKQIVYFQDTQMEQPIPSAEKKYIKIKTGDILSIVVSSKDPELAVMFNLPRTQQVVGYTEIIRNTNGQTLGYTVDGNGNIDFPRLGLLHIEGLRREEIALMIKQELSTKGLLQDAIVTVDYLNLSFSVMGEVTRPGQININKDCVTLLDAISLAGDLTIYGKRDRIFVTRQTDSKRVTYHVDIRTNKIYDSPAFYIQQNDLIYVEPNTVRANQSTVNANNLQSVSLWISVASFLTTIGVLIFK